MPAQKDPTGTSTVGAAPDHGTSRRDRPRQGHQHQHVETCNQSDPGDVGRKTLQAAAPNAWTIEYTTGAKPDPSYSLGTVAWGDHDDAKKKKRTLTNNDDEEQQQGINKKSKVTTSSVPATT